MNPEIEENKRQYWAQRHAAEDAWEKLVINIREDPRYTAMTDELEQINDKIAYKKEYYLCKYEIHPDDLNVTDLDSPDDRGGYADTLHRSDHFGHPLITLQNGHYTELTDELPFPMPDEPVYFVFSSQCLRFALPIKSYITALCLLCGYNRAKLPLGFICGECESDKTCLEKIYNTKTKAYNISEMAELRITQFEKEMTAYRQMAAEPKKRHMPEEIINVECYDWRDCTNDPKDVTVRLQLTKCTKVQVCKKHEFDDDDNCTNCQFGCIDY